MMKAPAGKAAGTTHTPACSHSFGESRQTDSFFFVPTEAEEEEKEGREEHESQTEATTETPAGTRCRAVPCRAESSRASQAEVERNAVQTLCCCSQVHIS